MKRILSIATVLLVLLAGCETTSTQSKSDTKADIENTQNIGDKLSNNQATPTDIDYSLERFNLIKRAYWVNGQREKANSLVSGVTLPLGYIVLFSSNSVVAQFTVEGKVSSLNSFLTPNMVQKLAGMYSDSSVIETELPDIDGSYGENDNGIFFFTVDGKYVEWTGDYIYSDIPLFIENPTIQVGE